MAIRHSRGMHRLTYVVMKDPEMNKPGQKGIHSRKRKKADADEEVGVTIDRLVGGWMGVWKLTP